MSLRESDRPWGGMGGGEAWGGMGRGMGERERGQGPGFPAGESSGLSRASTCDPGEAVPADLNFFRTTAALAKLFPARLFPADL